MQQSFTAVDDGRDCEDQQQHNLALGTAKLKSVGILNFGLAKPCHRRSAVKILTGSSHQPLTGSSPACEPHKNDHNRAVTADERSSNTPSNSPANIIASSAPRSRRSTAGCCRDDDAVRKDVKRAPNRLHRIINSSSGGGDSRGCRYTAPAPDTPQACAAAAPFSRSSSNSSDASTAADASHSQAHGVTHSNSVPTDSSRRISRNGCIASYPAAAPAVLPQLQHATVGNIKAKTYTAALLRRQEAQAHANEQEQRQQQQSSRGAKLGCMSRMQDRQSSSSGAQHHRGIPGVTCRLSLTTPVHISKAAYSAVCSTLSTSCSTGSSSIPGLHLSHLRRVSLTSCSSEGDGPHSSTPPLTVAESHHALSFFSRSSSLKGTSSTNRHSSCSTAGSSGTVISKYGVPAVAAAAAGRSLLLSALDAATTANARAAAALRHAARRALQAGTAATKADRRMLPTAVQCSWSDGGAAAHLTEADQAAVAAAVMGWYNEADGCVGSGTEIQLSDAVAGVSCTTERVQQQQPCACPSVGLIAADTCTKSGPRCACGLNYSRLQRSSSLNAQCELQQPIERQPSQSDKAQGCSSSSTSGSSTHSGAMGWQPAIPAGDTAAAAAAASGGGVSDCAAGVGSHVAADAEPPLSADCIAGASIEALLVASTWCIAELECGFERMKRTSEELADTDGVPLREQYLQQVVQ